MSSLKQVAVLVVLAVIAAGGYLAWQELFSEATTENAKRRSGGGPAVETAAAQFADIETVVEAVGTTRAVRAVEVTPSASGRIREITFEAGQRVEDGAVLVRLDDEIERADLAEAEAQLLEARRALQRAQALKKSSATSQAAVEKAVVVQATAQANRDRAARRLRDKTVTAPFPGIVGFARVEQGARIEPGDTVTTLDDLSTVEIDFSLPENLYGRITPGKTVIATATAFPGRRFSGTTERIDSRIDPVSRAFRARAVVANPDYSLPAGMFMHLTVVLDSRNALTVPEEAIMFEGDQAFAFVIDKTGERMVARKRPMELGQRSFGNVEIIEGIAEGEAVITRGVQKAKDGRPVRMVGPGGGPGGQHGGPGKGGKGGTAAGS